MKIQKVTGNAVVNGVAKRVSKFVSSDDAAGKARAELRKDGFRNDELSTTVIEFEPTKTGIIGMLNEHAN